MADGSAGSARKAANTRARGGKSRFKSAAKIRSERKAAGKKGGKK